MAKHIHILRSVESHVIKHISAAEKNTATVAAAAISAPKAKLECFILFLPVVILPFFRTADLFALVYINTATTEPIYAENQK